MKVFIFRTKGLSRPNKDMLKEKDSSNIVMLCFCITTDTNDFALYLEGSIYIYTRMKVNIMPVKQ
ncbi:MAG TPA: hypothetical protein VE076_05825 [Nitrososphaeraceae archaeon]|nr:hypothetical protein [Nitrososphaeraceae archaeon]